MKLENIELSFDNFSSEMSKLKNQKHFDYLVTIIGEDFGEEGLGCIYILENTDNNERCSVKTIASSSLAIPTCDVCSSVPILTDIPCVKTLT